MISDQMSHRLTSHLLFPHLRFSINFVRFIIGQMDEKAFGPPTDVLSLDLAMQELGALKCVSNS